MKAFLSFLLACLGVSAATPSFSSFNTNQFATNNLFISIKDGAVITNLNVATDLFLNSTNIVNLFAPSSSGNIFNTNQFTTNASIVSSISTIDTATLLQKYAIVTTNLFFQNLSSGTNDLFTIPAGYVAIPITVRHSTTNTSATTTQRLVKTNSVYYPLGVAVSCSTNNFTGMDNGGSNNFPFQENETLSVVTSTTGTTIAALVWLMPTNAPVFVGKNFALTAGDNTLYTVPSNNLVLPFGMATVLPGNVNIVYFNFSGSQRVVSYHIVANGDVPGGHNKIQNNTIANNAIGSCSLLAVSSGYSLVLNTDDSTATQIAVTFGVLLQ